MNIYLECFKGSKIARRLSVTLIPERKRDFIKTNLEKMGYEVKTVESEDELETGYL